MAEIRAYSCRPAGAEWHVIAFAATGQRARVLAFAADPGCSDFIEWRARRFPRADGMYASEAVWVHADDAPEWHRAEASGFWQELNARMEEPS